MREQTINLWDALAASKDAVACITVNGFVKKNGCCVMGRGCALEAAKKFPGFPLELGNSIKKRGNRVVVFWDKRLATFPTKHVWWEKSDPELIRKSARTLAAIAKAHPTTFFYLPRPGCGNGKLDWAEVRPMVASILPDNVVVVNYPQAWR